MSSSSGKKKPFKVNNLDKKNPLQVRHFVIQGESKNV